MTLRRLARRVAALFLRGRLERELDDEIAAHLELAERDARAAGLSPEEARRETRRRFGGIEAMKEAHREARGVPWLETMARDARHGAAALRREPVFTAVVIGLLGLGIGASTAMFSVLDGVLLKPLPFPHPERIVRIWEAPRPGVTNATSTPDFLDWRGLDSAFEAVAAEDGGSVALTTSADPVRLMASKVTADYFKVFGIAPALGRGFAPGDDQPGAEAVVILSDATWRTFFGAAPDILRQRPILDGRPHQVIGVLPPGFFDRSDAAVWTPLVFASDQNRRDWHWLTVSARLAPGVTAERARDEIRALRAAQADVTPAFKRDWSIEIEPLDRLLVDPSLRSRLVVAGGAVLLLLLIACANVANLLLARGTMRTREMVIRIALGAGRARVTAQLLTESVMLCLLGGGAGVLLAWWLVRAVPPALAGLLPARADVALDGRALAFAVVACVATVLLAGLAPAFQAAVRGASAVAGGLGRTVSAGKVRLRRAIVVVEVGMSVVLLCTALLFAVTLANLLRIDPGVRIDGLLTASLELPRRVYSTPARAAQFCEALTAGLAGTPGVIRAALTTYLPMRWVSNGESITVPGVEQPIRIRFKRVSPDYFATLDIPVTAGRAFAATDRSGGPPVAIVNQALAAQLATIAHVRRLVGQTVGLRFGTYDQDVQTSAEIVGVIRSERTGDPWRADPPVVYVPLAQAPHSQMKLIVRSNDNAAAVLPAVRQALRSVDPALPLGEVATMREVRDRTYLFASRPAWIVGAFAAAAMLLAALGLYGVLEQSVSRQRRELAIRIALGAAPRGLMWRTVGSALWLIGLGSVCGGAVSAGLAPGIRSVLYGVSPLDPLVMTGAVAAMGAAGVAAAWLPARRAARVDPMAVLRDDI